MASLVAPGVFQSEELRLPLSPNQFGSDSAIEPITKSSAQTWRTSEFSSQGVRFIDYSESRNSKE